MPALSIRGAAAALLTVVALAPALAADDTIFTGLGGKPGIQRIVDNLVSRVLADPRIKETFSDSDMKHVAMRLQEQFCVVAGGPCVYGGEPMKETHGGLQITNAQFNALVEDLQMALDDNGVPSALQNRLIGRLAPMQREIVTK